MCLAASATRAPSTTCMCWTCAVTDGRTRRPQDPTRCLGAGTRRCMWQLATRCMCLEVRADVTHTPRACTRARCRCHRAAWCVLRCCDAASLRLIVCGHCARVVFGPPPCNHAPPRATTHHHRAPPCTARRVRRPEARVGHVRAAPVHVAVAAGDLLLRAPLLLHLRRVLQHVTDQHHAGVGVAHWRGRPPCAVRVRLGHAQVGQGVGHGEAAVCTVVLLGACAAVPCRVVCCRGVCHVLPCVAVRHGVAVPCVAAPFAVCCCCVWPCCAALLRLR